MVKRSLVFFCLLIVALAIMALAAPASALQPPAGQTEFVPISQLPPADQLPAAPLLVGAYAFVWLGLMAYMWSIWRRLGKVEADMRALERRGSKGSSVR